MQSEIETVCLIAVLAEVRKIKMKNLFSNYLKNN